MKRRFANVELASIGNDPFAYGFAPTWGKIRLSSKDRFLIERGGANPQALDLYLDLLTDNQAFFAWDRQISEITSRELIVEAGGDNEIDIEAAEYVRNLFHTLAIDDRDIDDNELAIVGNGLGIDGITRGLGVSLITGISFGEIIWKRDKQYLPTVEAVKIRDPRRFIFESQNGKVYLKLLTRSHSFNGINVPGRKFIVCRYWAIPSDDYYGSGLGRLIYYPVTWKRELLTLWLTIVDKYSDPTVIGSYEEDIEDSVKKEFIDGLSSISREMIMTMPKNFDVEFISPTLNGPEILENLEKLCNSYINKIFSGETNTGEPGGGGVMRENISNSIRLMKAKAFSDSISETLNNSLVKWLTLYRFPSAKPPRIWRNFGDVSETITTLKDLKTLGYSTTEEFIENLTGIPLNKAASKKSFV